MIQDESKVKQSDTRTIPSGKKLRKLRGRSSGIGKENLEEGRERAGGRERREE